MTHSMVQYLDIKYRLSKIKAKIRTCTPGGKKKKTREAQHKDKQDLYAFRKNNFGRTRISLVGLQRLQLLQLIRYCSVRGDIASPAPPLAVRRKESREKVGSSWSDKIL